MNNFENSEFEQAGIYSFITPQISDFKLQIDFFFSALEAALAGRLSREELRKYNRLPIIVFCEPKHCMVVKQLNKDNKDGHTVV